MTELQRRALLASLAAAGGTAVAGCTGSDSSPNETQTQSGPQTDQTLVEQTLAPASDGNPATISFDAEPGAVLTIDAAYDNAAVFNLFGGDSGRSVATGGIGVVHEQATQVTSEPLPDADTQPTLAVAMHSDDRVDLTVTAVNQSEPTPKPSNPATALREEVATVSQTLGPTSSAEDGLRVSGPLWVRLFDQKLTMVQQAREAQTALTTAQQAVYGGLVRQHATTWVNEQVEQIASFLTTATVTLVSLKTGLPAGLLEGTLESELESALEGDSVTWSYSEPQPQSLSPTGGEVNLVATADIELSVEGFGVRIEAPIRLLGTADGERIPASAAIDDFQVLTEQATVELL